MGIRFGTPDRKWTVETAFLSCVTPVSDTTHWGDPQHRDGMYLVARGCGMIFYAGSPKRDLDGRLKSQDEHLAGAWAELAAANLFDITTLEMLVTIELPASLAADAAEAIGTAGRLPALAELQGYLREAAA